MPGVAGAYEYRLTSTITVGEASTEQLVDYTPERTSTRVSVYMDIFGFTAGPTEINLLAVGAPRPATRAVEDRLLVLLYSRTKRHKP